MPDPMMAMMFAMRNAIPPSTVISLRDREATPTQRNVTIGDTCFMMRDDGFYNDQLTVVEVLDPTDVCPDWQERASRGYLYCRWHSVEEPTGDYGWFARIFVLPIQRATYDALCAAFVELDGKTENGYFDSEPYPELDRAYRTFASEASEKEEKLTPAKCESCFSVQVEIKMDHISHIKGTGVWHTMDDGRVLLAPASKVSDCENIASMTCLDCGWSRSLDEEELLTSHH